MSQTLATHVTLRFTCVNTKADPMVQAHVEADRGGLVHIDKLPRERCRRLSLDKPACMILRMLEELFPGSEHFTWKHPVG